jgi:hypothetical protein
MTTKTAAAPAKKPAAKKTTTAKKAGADLDVSVEKGDGPSADELAARRRAREQEETGEGVTRQTANGEQLSFSLVIGGAKPTTSVITVSAKQLTYADREFQKGDVLSFSGEIRVVEVGARDKKKGTQRFHKAVVDRLVIEGESDE